LHGTLQDENLTGSWWIRQTLLHYECMAVYLDQPIGGQQMRPFYYDWNIQLSIPSLKIISGCLF
jgi:hypothetical protein